MNSDQSYRSGGSAMGSSRSGLNQDVRAAAGEAASKISEVAQQAGSQAKQAAASIASEANERAKGFLNQQVEAGADVVGNVAEAARRAADHLDHESPQIAGFVRSAADKVDEFSQTLRHQSVEEIVSKASDFTRRQPALVFGLASLAGFFLLRVLKAGAPSNGASQDHRSVQTYSGPGSTRQHYGPGAGEFRSGAGQFHGA